MSQRKSKPVITLRKPPDSPNPEDMEKFVSNDLPAPIPERPKVQTSRRPKRSRKQVTIYLNPVLARRLKLHAVENEQEMSDIVAYAVEQYLVKP